MSMELAIKVFLVGLAAACGYAAAQELPHWAVTALMTLFMGALMYAALTRGDRR